MAPLKILVLGHSHITALAKAFLQGEPGVSMDFVLLNNPEYQPPLSDEGLHPAILEKIHAARAGLHVSLLGGNDHSIIGMLNHPRRFDFVLPEAPDLPVDETAEILPAGLLLAHLAQRVAPHLAVLALYRAAVPGRLVHVESPPPIPSEAHIRAHPGVFREMIEERGVSPGLLRYKFWRLHSELYARECARIGVEFLPAPEAMRDEQGMMRPEAWNPDPTHGNALYGRHVIGSLLAA